ncbi:hypothetical protein H0H92_012809, partial [Tricholoma furcatifolium]
HHDTTTVATAHPPAYDTTLTSARTPADDVATTDNDAPSERGGEGEEWGGTPGQTPVGGEPRDHHQITTAAVTAPNRPPPLHDAPTTPHVTTATSPRANTTAPTQTRRLMAPNGPRPLPAPPTRPRMPYVAVPRPRGPHAPATSPTAPYAAQRLPNEKTP